MFFEYLLIMKQKVRPLSPHLTVYKPQLTSLLSIFHRIAGSVLGLTLILSCILFYVSLLYVGFCLNYGIFFDFGLVFSNLIDIIKYLILSLVLFHVMNGIRHLSWDLGFGLEIKSLYVTGVIVLGIVSCVVLISITV